MSQTKQERFLFQEPLPEEWRARLVAFLEKLGPGKLETSPKR